MYSLNQLPPELKKSPKVICASLNDRSHSTVHHWCLLNENMSSLIWGLLANAPDKITRTSLLIEASVVSSGIFHKNDLGVHKPLDAYKFFCVG